MMFRAQLQIALNGSSNMPPSRRIDYDPEKGMHINVVDYTKGKGINAEKYVIQFNGDEKNFETILNTLNR